MRVDVRQLAECGRAADGLGDTVKSSMSALDRAHDGLAQGAEGFALAASLAGALGSWEERLSRVRGACWSVAEDLAATARNHQSNERETADAFDPWARG